MQMGKRGPKPGHGGRPVKYSDPFHIIARAVARESRRRRSLADAYLTLKVEQKLRETRS